MDCALGFSPGAGESEHTPAAGYYGTGACEEEEEGHGYDVKP